MDDIIKRVQFTTRYYDPLYMRDSALLFMADMAAAAGNILPKAIIWDSMFLGNVPPSMAELAQILNTNSIPHPIKWVIVESAFKVLVSVNSHYLV